MKKGNKKIFVRDKDLLSQMLALRYYGYALTSLANMFGCDRTSISHHCKMFHIRPVEQVYTIERIVSQIIPKEQPTTYKIVNGERINLGKSYAEYLSS